MTAENDRAPDLLVEEIALLDAVEIAIEEMRRDALNLLGRVERVTRLRQRVLVHVGCVDLDPASKLFDAEMLGQEYGDRVRLLAGRTSGAPHADGRLGTAGRNDARDDVGRDEVPRLRVTEEAGNVDEDGVEQQAELVLMRL